MGIYCKSVAIILILFLYVFIGENGNLGHKSQQWLYDFVLLGGLVNDTYESFSLESGVETQIAYGPGAYYICGPVSDTLSCIAVVNYYSVETLGVVGGLTFRVAERTLYATSDGASDIRVKKIRTKS